MPARELDAGSYDRVTARLLERLPQGRVVALDGSQAMLDRAAERFAGDPRVVLLRADLEAPLPLGEPLDAVVSTSALHWIRDHDALWRHLRAALRPGGVLAVEFGGAGNIAGVLDHVDHVARLGPDAAPRSCATWRPGCRSRWSTTSGSRSGRPLPDRSAQVVARPGVRGLHCTYDE